MSELISAIFITAGYGFLYLSSIIIHEFGHIYFYKHLTGKKASIKLTKRGFHLEDGEELRGLTHEQYYGVLWGGLITGFLWLSIWFLLIPHGYNYMYFPILALYLWGSKSDIEQIIKTKPKITQ